MSVSGAATSLFIDWIGAGGGVGARGPEAL
jgi:hypothetical protein